MQSISAGPFSATHQFDQFEQVGMASVRLPGGKYGYGMSWAGYVFLHLPDRATISNYDCL